MSRPQFLEKGSYQEKILFNAMAITDTSSHFGSQYTSDIFTKVDFLINNTLNQTVNVNPLGGLKTGGLAYAVESQNSGTPSSIGFSLTSGSSILISDIPISGQIGCLASCSTAPTSGSLTVTAILRR